MAVHDGQDVRRVNGSTGGGVTTLLLSAMMFLQFFLWGAWFVTLGPFMSARGASDGDVGNAYSTAPIAAIVAPFFLGIVADRFFASQRVMAVLHLVGGGLLIAAPIVLERAGVGAFVGTLLAHMLCYMPTLGLSNTVAFHAMSNPAKQFPLVRVWGTVGWIVAGLAVGTLAKSLVSEAGTFASVEVARAASSQFFTVAGASGLALGLLSFALPHTPPPMRGQPARLRSILGLDSLSLLKDPNFAVFAVASLLVCVPLAAYYQKAATYAGAVGLADVPIKMTFGQMSEILFMVVMPLFFARLGVKWMLAVGMLAWVVRYALFGLAWEGGPGGEHLGWMVIVGIVLHGICYDFFFVTGQIYTEQRAPAQIRAQAQGFLVLLTQGVGMLIGNQLFPRVIEARTDASGAVDWTGVWLTPAVFAATVLVVFCVLFSGRRARAKVEGEAAVPGGAGGAEGAAVSAG